MKQKTPDPGPGEHAGVRPSAPAPRKSKGLSLEIPALLAGLVLGAAAALYWAGSASDQQAETQARQLRAELVSHQAELAGMRAQLDALTGRLVVEESTRKGLEATLQATQSELGQARDQLAFFDQLLPPGPKGAISIRALDIERLGPTLQYKVLLMRNAQDDRPFKGHMQFVASGVQQGKAVKITLQPALAPGSADPAAAGGAEGQDLVFDQFLRSGGLLSVPEDFTPQAVTLNILEGGALRVSRKVNLPAPE
ncbi:MAG TPA: DUF6776 family protein [Burkholderiaceae bacterium]|nr:DUF6776 family protein [Burkholderiaceae bacterium]